MEPEKEERAESPPSSLVMMDIEEPPQLPVNGMTYSAAEYTALARLGYGVTSFSDGDP